MWYFADHLDPVTIFGQQYIHRCGRCGGHAEWRGGDWSCTQDAEFCNTYPMPGREHVERGVIELVLNGTLRTFF